MSTVLQPELRKKKENLLVILRWAFTPTTERVWLPEPLRLATCHVIRPAQVLMGALIIKWPQWEHSEDAICRAREKRGDGQRCRSRGHKTTEHFYPLTRPAIQESNRGCKNISLYGDFTTGPREAGKPPSSFEAFDPGVLH